MWQAFLHTQKLIMKISLIKLIVFKTYTYNYKASACFAACTHHDRSYWQETVKKYEAGQRAANSWYYYII